MMAGKGDLLPGHRLPRRRHLAHRRRAQWEKRNIAAEIPVWDPTLCIQCNKCALVCPHAAIRAKVYEPALAEGAPATFKSDAFRAADFKGLRYTIQVAPRTAPAARSASRSARPRTRRTRGTRRSTWRRRRRCARPSARTTPSSSTCPSPTARGCGSSTSRARSSCSRSSSTRAPARAAARRRTSSC